MSKGFKVKGIKSTINRHFNDRSAERDTEKLTYESAMRLGVAANRRAPVLTGLLSGTLISGIERDYTSPKEFPIYEMLQRTDYTVFQEFNHATKSGFIRNSVIEEKPKFRQALEGRYKKRGGRR